MAGRKVPAPLPDDQQWIVPDLPLDSIDDAMKLCGSTVRELRTGQLQDTDLAQAIFRGITAYCNAYVARMKHNPAELAKREFAKAQAQRVAETIDLSKAKDILTRRSWNTFEAEGAVIDIEAVNKENEEKAQKLLGDSYAGLREAQIISGKKRRGDAI